MPAWTSKAAAAVIALVCWAGIALQFSATYETQADVLRSLWVLGRFFTILTNLAVAIAMTRIAFDGSVRPLVLGGLTLAIILVGIVYVLLLRGLHPLAGPALIANELLHYVSPVATAAYWLAFAPHGRLRWTAPLWWSLYPVAYFAYVLGRGGLDGRYPYPFLDVAKIGFARTLANAAAIAIAFVLFGLAVVYLDRILGRRRATR